MRKRTLSRAELGKLIIIGPNCFVLEAMSSKNQTQRTNNEHRELDTVWGSHTACGTPLVSHTFKSLQYSKWWVMGISIKHNVKKWRVQKTSLNLVNKNYTENIRQSKDLKKREQKLNSFSVELDHSVTKTETPQWPGFSPKYYRSNQIHPLPEEVVSAGSRRLTVIHHWSGSTIHTGHSIETVDTSIWILILQNGAISSAFGPWSALVPLGGVAGVRRLTPQGPQRQKWSWLGCCTAVSADSKTSSFWHRNKFYPHPPSLLSTSLCQHNIKLSRMNDIVSSPYLLINLLSIFSLTPLAFMPTATSFLTQVQFFFYLCPSCCSN